MKPRVLLAWESGAGRGHLVTLKHVATALGDACIYDAALCRMEHAAEIRPLCELVFPAVALHYDSSRRQGPQSVPTATWGEFLGDSGFLNPAALVRNVSWWRDTLIARCTDLVVADYAPCALMAAASLGIPAVAVGTGYGLPPEGMQHFPIFLPEYSQRLHDEAEMVEIINGALAPLGVPTLRYLPDVYRRSQELVRTLDILDPYAELRTQPLLPPVADVAPASVGQGDEVFIYFSTTELENSEIIDAICTLPLPIRAYCPAISEDRARMLAGSGVALETAPVPAALIAQRTRLMVHAGQHGILCLGVGAGLPQVSLPQHLEHLFHARRIEKAGAGLVAPMKELKTAALRSTILEAYESRRMGETARDLASTLSEQFAADGAGMIRERLLPLLSRH